MLLKYYWKIGLIVFCPFSMDKKHALSVLRFTASDYTFGIFWPLRCLSFDLRLLITPLVSFGHCIVCPSIYGFWLHLWYLWPLRCLSFDLRLLITPLVSFGHCIVCPSIYGFWLRWLLITSLISLFYWLRWLLLITNLMSLFYWLRWLLITSLISLFY